MMIMEQVAEERENLINKRKVKNPGKLRKEDLQNQEEGIDKNLGNVVFVILYKYYYHFLFDVLYST